MIKQLKQIHSLTNQEIADLCHVSIHTVNSWLKPPTSKSHNKCPLVCIELAYRKCGEQLPPEFEERRMKDLASRLPYPYKC